MQHSHFIMFYCDCSSCQNHLNVNVFLMTFNHYCKLMILGYIYFPCHQKINGINKVSPEFHISCSTANGWETPFVLFDQTKQIMHNSWCWVTSVKFAFIFYHDILYIETVLHLVKIRWAVLITKFNIHIIY